MKFDVLQNPDPQLYAKPYQDPERHYRPGFSLWTDRNCVFLKRIVRLNRNLLLQATQDFGGYGRALVPLLAAL